MERVIRKKYCSVPSCKNNLGTAEDVRMFKFPKDHNEAKKWNKAIGFNNERAANGMICCEHFQKQEFEMRRNGKIFKLAPGAIPSIFEPIHRGSPTELIMLAEELNIGSTHSLNGSQTQTDVLVSHYVSPPELTTLLTENVSHGEGTAHNTNDSKSSDGEQAEEDDGWDECDQCDRKDVLIMRQQTTIKRLQNRLDKRSLRRLAKKANYLTKRVNRLRDTSKQMSRTILARKEQMKMDHINTKLLEAFKQNDLLYTLIHGVRSRGLQQYSPIIRRFCLSLHYYSPRAYEFVRKSFNNNLPHPKTIQSWYSNSDIRGEAGIQKEHLERLKNIANDFSTSNQNEMVCGLIFDEMNIRQQVYWSRNHLDFVGVIEENDKTAVVKQVIVFYLNGVNTKFEYPVAYYVIDNLNSTQRKDLVVKIVIAVTECGIRISNLTFDGLYCNTKSCELLGANLDVQSVDFQPYFLNPHNGEKIFIILDPCHMQKLVRNTLAGRGIIFHRKNSQNFQIKWDHIVLLHEYSKTNDMRTHKLTKKHIQWRENDMNVSLAVQTLSQSVANSIAFLKAKNHQDFADAGPTIEFVEVMNKLFDIFNTRGSADRDIFKQALSESNCRVVFDFFKKATNYLKSLYIDDAKRNAKSAEPKMVQITKSRKKTAFRGYIINMSSLKLMFDEFIKNRSGLKLLSTYYLQQDVLEMFFGKIRARCGFNNNPNVDQFKGAYRRLLGNLEIISSPFSNCRLIDDELPENVHYSNIYFVSSEKRKTTFTDIEDIYIQQKDDILVEVARLDGLKKCNSLLDNTTNYSIFYIASQIEKKITFSPNFYCNSCPLVFDENDNYELIGINALESPPCRSTFKICENAEKFFKIHNIQHTQKPFDFKVIYCLIFRTLNFNELFPNSTFDCGGHGTDHKYQFIKCIVGEYISLRATQLSRDVTLDQYKTIFRRRLNRMIIFSGQ